MFGIEPSASAVGDCPACIKTNAVFARVIDTLFLNKVHKSSFVQNTDKANHYILHYKYKK